MLVFVALPPAGAGEIEDFAELDLEELLDVNVYTAAKHEQDIAESPSAISVITREQIENTACTDVFCLLRQVPEVDIEWLRMMFVAVGARALTDALCDKGLVLVDGREVNDEIFGVVYWMALPVHLDEIERIEVIRGPGSALYGANAHSLVVSITTRQDTSGTAEVFLGSGEHDRSSLNLRLGRKFGDVRAIVSVGAGCCLTTRPDRPPRRWTPGPPWPRGLCTPPWPRLFCTMAFWPTCCCATAGRPSRPK
jgi:iron complex outermembrane receptor protein